jgi:hypothetical protein
MSLRTRILTAVSFVAVLVALGTTDVLLTGKRMKFPALSASVSHPTQQEAIGVMRNEGASVPDILRSQSIETATSSEQSLLERIVPADAKVQTQILLKSNDRIALFAWIETPNAKTYFAALKDALHASFSPAVKDLRDDMELSSDRPARNILTFRDPAISAERITFIRIRQRIYELHTTDGKDADVQALMDVLSR